MKGLKGKAGQVKDGKEKEKQREMWAELETVGREKQRMLEKMQ